MYAPEVEAQERKHERISGIVTTVLVVLFLLFALIEHLLRDRVPPPGAKEYEVVGAIDFGDYRQGSRNVNNFQPAVENPSQSSAETAQPTPAEVSDNNPTPSNEMTQPDLSPVSQPAPQSQPQSNPTPPQTQSEPEPQPQPTDNNNASNSQSQPQEDDLQFELESGSNQGNNSSGTGNAGTPDVKVLDPKGLYSFAEGNQGGLNGRRPLSLREPSYTSQEEGQLTFELTIRPDGSVSYVRVASPTTKLSLKQAGIEAIKRWRFSALPPGAPRKNQTVRVTITFKLKD
jgi:TonB family protein